MISRRAMSLLNYNWYVRRGENRGVRKKILAMVT